MKWLKDNWIGLFVAVLFGVWFYYEFYRPPVIQYVDREVPVQIDSTKWVLKATYLKEKQIRQEIEKHFGEALKDQNMKIATLTQLNAYLSTELDSAMRVDFIVCDTSFVDSIKMKNKLFLITNKITLDSMKMSRIYDLKQLRPLELNVVTNIDKEKKIAYIWVESKDIDSLNYQGVYTIPEDDLWTIIKEHGPVLASSILLGALLQAIFGGKND